MSEIITASAVRFNELSATHDGYTLLYEDNKVCRSDVKLSELVGDKSAYLTEERANTLYQGKGDYLSASTSANFYPMTGNPSGFLTSEKDWTDTIKAASANAVNTTSAWVSANYYNIEEINDFLDEKYDTSSFAAVSGTFLTAHQDLNNYYTKSETSSKNELNLAFDTKQDKGDYYSASNPSGFLTAHQDLSNYYTKQETSAAGQLSAEFEKYMEIPIGLSADKQYGYTVSGWEEISAGSNLSAGTDLKIENDVISVDTNGSAVGKHSFVEGENTYAGGLCDHVEGMGGIADNGGLNHIEGFQYHSYGGNGSSSFIGKNVVQFYRSTTIGTPAESISGDIYELVKAFKERFIVTCEYSNSTGYHYTQSNFFKPVLYKIIDVSLDENPLYFNVTLDGTIPEDANGGIYLLGPTTLCYLTGTGGSLSSGQILQVFTFSSFGFPGNDLELIRIDNAFLQLGYSYTLPDESTVSYTKLLKFSNIEYDTTNRVYILTTEESIEIPEIVGGGWGCGIYVTNESYYGGNHKEGRDNSILFGSYNHAEGAGNVIRNANNAHVEGEGTSALSTQAHAEGYCTYVTGSRAHAEGYKTSAIGTESHAEGNSTSARGQCSHAEGNNTKANEYASHAEGVNTFASGYASHTEGYNTKAFKEWTHAEGSNTSAVAYGSHAEGQYTLANGVGTHTEGNLTSAYGSEAHAEGYGTYAWGSQSHAENYYTSAYGNYSHAEGQGTFANNYAHAEGQFTHAEGEDSHAEGQWTSALGSRSHSEGHTTIANGTEAHAEGFYTSANSNYSHSEGYYTIAGSEAMHAGGKYNATSADALFVIGNGTADDARSDAFIIYPNGSVSAAGKISANGVELGAGGGGGTTYNAGQGIKISNDNTISINSNNCSVTGAYAFAEGSGTSAHGNYSLAENFATLASGDYSHAEGAETSAIKLGAHAEGICTLASGNYAHTEGYKTSALAQYSHAEGYNTKTVGSASHAEGNGTIAGSPYMHVCGKFNKTSADALFVIGNGTYYTPSDAFVIYPDGSVSATGKISANGVELGAGGGGATYNAGQGIKISNDNTISISSVGCSVTGSYAFAEGGNNSAHGDYSHAEGYSTWATGAYSHSEGYGTRASWLYSHAEGYQTTANSYADHVEGIQTKADFSASHAEGYITSAINVAAHAEGRQTLANGQYSHAEGYMTNATGYCSHAEGQKTSALSNYSHAEGSTTLASSNDAHAEGYLTSALVDYSHAEGWQTNASGTASHAAGAGTTAECDYETVVGTCNATGRTDNPLFVVGNGDYDFYGNRTYSDAFVVNKAGIASASNDIKASGISLIDLYNAFTALSSEFATYKANHP